MVCIVHASPMHCPCIVHASHMHCPCIYPGGFAAKMMEAQWLALGEGPASHVTLVHAVRPPTHTGPRELNSLNSLYYLLLLTSIFFSLRPDLTLKMKSNIFLILEAILLTEHLSWEWNFHSYELPVHNNLHDIC